MMSRGVIFDLDGTLLDKAAGMTCVGVTTSYEFEESGGVETNGSTPPRAFALPPRRSLANESLARCSWPAEAAPDFTVADFDEYLKGPGAWLMDQAGSSAT